MSNEFKDTDRNSHTYYFFNDIIKIKKFNPSNIKDTLKASH